MAKLSTIAASAAPDRQPEAVPPVQRRCKRGRARLRCIAVRLQRLVARRTSLALLMVEIQRAE